MKAEIKVPTVGESITEATIGEWAKKSGEFVKRDEIILLLDTDKASVEVTAPNDGVLTTMAAAGETVKIGAVVALIDTEGVATAGMQQPAKNVEKPASTPAPNAAVAAPVATPAGKSISEDMRTHMSPAVARVANEKGLDPAQIAGTGKDGRLTKADAVNATPVKVQGGLGATAGNYQPATPAVTPGAPAKKQEIPPLPTPRGAIGARGQKRVAMTNIRKKIGRVR